MVSDFMVWPLLLLLGVTGQAGDLLDLLPTQGYWQAKHVVVSPDAMVHELAMSDAKGISAAIDDLGSPDSTVRDAAAAKLLAVGEQAEEALTAAKKSLDLNISTTATSLLEQIQAKEGPAHVRRLMAIRTLGELRDAKSLPALKPLLDSKRQFEADYARHAIDQINHKPSSRPVLDAALRRQDLALLPEKPFVIGQFSRRGEYATIDQLLQDGIADDKERQHTAEAITQAILPAIEAIGNVRFDGLSFGAAIDDNGNEGKLVLILHSTYNIKLVRALLPQDKLREVGGKPAIGNADRAFIALSDDRLVFVADGQGRLDDAFLQKLVTAADHPPAAKKLDEIAAQQTGIDTNKALWMRVVIPPAVWQANLGPFNLPPAVQHTKELIITADYVAEGVKLQITANCDSTDDARAMMGLVRLGIGPINMEIAALMQQDPAHAKDFATWQRFLGKLKMEVKDKSLIATDVFTPDMLMLPVVEGVKMLPPATNAPGHFAEPDAAHPGLPMEGPGNHD